MAKHGKKSARMSSYLRGSVDELVSLGTLAGATLISAIFGETVEGRTRISSIEAAYSIGNVTPQNGLGPVLVGVAHSDYTDVEIEAWVETTGTWARGNMTQQEVSKRRIRKIGILDIPDSIQNTVTLNDGRPIKTKLNWQLEEGQTLRLWAYNLSGTAFATSDPVVRAQGHANLFSL